LRGGAMRNKHIAIISFTGIVAIVLTTAFVENGICLSDEAKAKEAARIAALMKVNNTICPVTGNEVDMNKPVTVQYNGKIYNLCCPMCPLMFKLDPIKYSKIAEDQAKEIGKQSAAREKEAE